MKDRRRMELQRLSSRFAGLCVDAFPVRLPLTLILSTIGRLSYIELIGVWEFLLYYAALVTAAQHLQTLGPAGWPVLRTYQELPESEHSREI